ncbi:MAG: thioredoxin domain-containing protein, partial [Pseudolabrys sp.]
GGWPMTMFLTPAGEPVWGGTYFPKDSRYGRPAFVDVLREVSRLFNEEPDKIEQNRTALLARLAEKARPQGRATVGLKELDGAAKQVGNAFDTLHGGLGGAPKYPQPMILEFLWRAGQRTQDPLFFQTVEHSLVHMCEGGIYDHLGGGFSRYSVDEKWLVPHFEKMLYDNAQLLPLLALAWQHSGIELFAERARETVGWLQREMVTGEGAFAASLDADSEGEEGKFYVWSLQEIEAILGPDAADFSAQYDVTPGGNFEGHNILNKLKHLPRSRKDGWEAAFAADRDPDAAARFSMFRGKLLNAREKRIPPGLDDKVLADWNGLMIAGLVEAGILLGEPSWLDMARRAFDFVAVHMTRDERQDSRLGHSWRAGQLLLPGLASDYAAMIRAALALYEATGESGFLERSLDWQRELDAHYADPETGAYFLTADDAGDLVVRPHSTADDAIPNANGLEAGNLVRLAVLTGDPQWREKADRLIEGIIAAQAPNLFGHVSLLNALDLRLRAAEIVCTGPDAEAFAHGALKLPYLDRIVLRAPSADALPATHPAQEKLKVVSGSAAFVCVGETCSLPVTAPEKIADAMAGLWTQPVS